MASYYKKINGKNYDRAVLEMAESCVAGQGDGRISLNDAKKIVAVIKDSGKITETEKLSLQYILKKYRFTDTAIEHIEKAIGKKKAAVKPKAAAKKTATPKKATAQKKSVKAKTPSPEPVRAKAPSQKEASVKMPVAATAELVQAEQPADLHGEKNSLWRYLLIVLILVLLIVALYFFYMKYRVKDASTPDNAADKTQEIKPADQQKPVQELKPADQQKKADETGTVKGADGVTRYVIKENDTLVKISIEHYNDYSKWELIWKHNKGVLKSPIMIFPGQVIELPEVK